MIEKYLGKKALLQFPSECDVHTRKVAFIAALNISSPPYISQAPRRTDRPRPHTRREEVGYQHLGTAEGRS